MKGPYESRKNSLLKVLFHMSALLLVIAATCAAIVNQHVGSPPGPDLLAESGVWQQLQFLVDTPQVKLPFLLFEFAVWLKGTTVSQLVSSLASLGAGFVLPQVLRTTLKDDQIFHHLNRVVVLSSIPSLILTCILHVFTPIPPPPRYMRSTSWIFEHLQRMLPCFLIGWTTCIDRQCKLRNAESTSSLQLDG